MALHNIWANSYPTSDVTKPLRELTQQDMEWAWDEPQKMALESLKDAVTRTPVLRYFNVKEDVTLQCDTSQSGLCAALLQNGQPVAYASRALVPAETQYAQIEKQLPRSYSHVRGSTRISTDWRE